ncbi:ParA family protein [Amycolatopsis rubida]|uniref:Cellulose biosynthesis protein BcsQ n=1 Tax=Amycolatopsis rubida TaxID=112413 RepID=A0A1I5XDP8_9PSEU|nr:AAA family ATPase [Amycolatopsis rubida]SFQ30103.1 Cellulose biosynthesis protein BcsQ [Amycolatopsis rubida]
MVAIVPSFEPDSLGVRWDLLGRVYLFGNDKGGVGKSTIAANAAGQAAQSGLRTLAVDLNAQGNMALDFGVSRNPEVNDNGKGLLHALTLDVPLNPVRGVRENLDFIPGGRYVRRIQAHLQPMMVDDEGIREAVTSLARALSGIAENYDLIILDSPPENELLLQLVLCAARFVVVPMKTDEASRIGLRALARVLERMRHVNPCLVLLGVVVFASSTNATNLRASLRDGVEDDLKGSAVPFFESFVRYAEAVGAAARKYGALAHELEAMLIEGTKPVAAGGYKLDWQYKAEEAERMKEENPEQALKKVPVVPGTAKRVAGDIEAVLQEMFSEAKQKRKQLKQEGLWV